MSDAPAFDMPPVSSGFDARGGWLLLRLMADLSLIAEQAAGIAGTLAAESGLTAIQERGVVSPKGGFGWAQWTADRRRNFFHWCADRDLNVTDDKANYGFMLEELKGAESHSLERLRQTTTVEAACETFVKQFERPAEPDKETARAIPFAKRAMIAAGHLPPLQVSFPSPRDWTAITPPSWPTSPNFPGIPLQPAPPPVAAPVAVPQVATPAVTSGIVAGGVSAVAMMIVAQAAWAFSSFLHVTIPENVQSLTIIGLATLFGWFLHTRLAASLKLDKR